MGQFRGENLNCPKKTANVRGAAPGPGAERPAERPSAGSWDPLGVYIKRSLVGYFAPSEVAIKRPSAGSWGLLGVYIKRPSAGLGFSYYNFFGFVFGHLAEEAFYRSEV